MTIDGREHIYAADWIRKLYTEKRASTLFSEERAEKLLEGRARRSFTKQQKEG